MKKILALIVCIVLVCAMPVIVFAEDEIPTTTAEEATATESLPSETENASQSENSGTEEAPKSEEQIRAELTTEQIVSYVKAHLEEISVIVTLIFTAIYNVRKHQLLNRSMATLNNNAITVAENGRESMQNALTEMGSMANTVGGYKTEIEAVLLAYKDSAEENKQLKKTLDEIHTHLKQSKAANTEFANELAELLVLANIPNSKKDELYARHRAAVANINAMENEPMEVTDGEVEEK